MTEAIDYVKTDLMPDFDFDAFSHENSENYESDSPYIAQNRREENSSESRVSAESPASGEATNNNPSGIAAAATPELDQESAREEGPAPVPESARQEEEVAERLETPKEESKEDTPPASNLFDEEVDKW